MSGLKKNSQTSSRVFSNCHDFSLKHGHSDPHLSVIVVAVVQTWRVLSGAGRVGLRQSLDLSQHRILLPCPTQPPVTTDLPRNLKPEKITYLYRSQGKLYIN